MSDLNVQNVNSKTGNSAISIADNGDATVGTLTLTGIVSGVWSDNGTANSSSKLVKLTQAQYDAITPDSNTIYFIV